MRIQSKPFVIKETEMNGFIHRNFDIILEGRDAVDDDGKEWNWSCRLFRGDDNAPWKLGTIHGDGYGDTVEAAFKAAVDGLQEVVAWFKT